MHPSTHARIAPDKPAYVLAEGEAVRYAALDARSNQAAQMFRRHGLKPGDGVAIFMENNARYYELVWGAQRAGLYYTCIASRLTAAEAAYIVEDSGARLVFVSPGVGRAAAELAALVAPGVTIYSVTGDIEGLPRYEAARDAMPTTPVADETAGAPMLYSSGTTGRPKGVWRPLSGGPIDAPSPIDTLGRMLYSMDENTIYLSPAPLYHAAPLAFSTAVQRIGGTVIVMEHFDPEQFLALIEKHKVTVTQVVPTMFVRMLKLPEEVRRRYDVSSLRCCIHAAAPCPVPVKEQMIDWWGPVLAEYYAGTEGNGSTYINSADWLSHKGSVGRALVGKVLICDEEGAVLPPGQTGTVYFHNEALPPGAGFEYHKDAKKTAESRHPTIAGASTLGDVGYLDEEGYLYLTDRKAFMIISGGANIYPQEVENLLVTHPKVADVAVFGVPNEDMGEEVKAVVQPLDWADATPETAAELIAFCRDRLAHMKCPRSVDFERELPRHATGKLYKRLLRDRYWGDRQSRIV